MLHVLVAYLCPCPMSDSRKLMVMSPLTPCHMSLGVMSHVELKERQCCYVDGRDFVGPPIGKENLTFLKRQIKTLHVSVPEGRKELFMVYAVYMLWGIGVPVSF